jgi:hypothetical protein
MAIANDYDRVTLSKNGGKFVTVSNVVISDTLSKPEDDSLNNEGYVIRKITDSEYHVIVNRLDVAALQKGLTEFYQTH